MRDNVGVLWFCSDGLGVDPEAAFAAGGGADVCVEALCIVKDNVVV